MMNRTKAILLISLLLAGMTTQAQRVRKKAAAKKPLPKVEVPTEDPRITAMREATQRVVIIDSVVTDKQTFLDAYQLSAEAGRLATYSDFFGNDQEPYSIVYQNGLADKCYYAQQGQLVAADYMNGQWATAETLKGMGDFDRANYPFMMADGTTLYFAATGEESIGGLDIFVTRYDSDKSRFLKAENLGMPFNSEANDYMLAIDEMNDIGYFASDRNQPEGQVCIYIFIPNKTRQTYETDELDEPTLKRLAAIERIADTWGDGKARKQALKRLEGLRADTRNRNTERQQDFTFIVDDQTVYTQLTDFQVAENRKRYSELTRQQAQFAKLCSQLEEARRRYAKATGEDRNFAETEIITNEHELNDQQRSIRQTEKEIRNSEIAARSAN